MTYPKDRDVDWIDLVARAQRVLESLGDEKPGLGRVYEDAFIAILYAPRRKNYLEITRKEMPAHPDGDHLRGSNPFYMEEDGKCFRTHGEGRYVYQHIIDLDEAL